MPSIANPLEQWRGHIHHLKQDREHIESTIRALELERAAVIHTIAVLQGRLDDQDSAIAKQVDECAVFNNAIKEIREAYGAILNEVP